jgi:hypothetical protein
VITPVINSHPNVPAPNGGNLLFMNGQRLQGTFVPHVYGADTAVSFCAGMPSRLQISALVVLLLASAVRCGAAPAGSHKVRVRLLEASSGKPISGMMLAIEWFVEARYPKGSQNEATNSDGVAVFELPDIADLRISPVYSPEDMGNCSEVQFSMAKVLESGVVAKNYCGAPKWMNTVSAKPGELVIFGKLTWFQELLRLRRLFSKHIPPCTEILPAFA